MLRGHRAQFRKISLRRDDPLAKRRQRRARQRQGFRVAVQS